LRMVATAQSHRLPNEFVCSLLGAVTIHLAGRSA
jgi:hypothetical protein